MNELDQSPGREVARSLNWSVQVETGKSGKPRTYTTWLLTNAPHDQWQSTMIDQDVFTKGQIGTRQLTVKKTRHSHP
jgi:hypothetical protein